ncbi:MAG: hypothetical protein IPP64_10715 [Bacteroidetes bacterium]|nr:hypothetical protein [Bacteroidota bacterium]
MSEYTETTYDLLKIIKKKKLHFIVVTLVTIGIAALFSSPLFMKPRYKSYAIMYPANITPYSEESASEQLLQLFGSADIRNAVVKKFNLYAYYKIDSTDKAATTYMIDMYDSRVEVGRTQFESVEISVLDEDPLRASAMVEEIIHSMNLKARELQREKSKEVEVIIKNQLELKKKNLDSIDERLHELRVKYQLFDYDMQVKEVTKSYLKAVAAGGKNLKEIDTMMRNLEEKGGEYFQLQKTMKVLLESYSKTKLEYDEVLKDINKELTYANVVTKPAPSFTKAYPIRWLIVLASVASANLFLFILFVILENRKN